MDDIPMALCLSELLDQDTSSYEFFQTLDPEIQSFLRQEDASIGTLDQLQARARLLHPALREADYEEL